MRGLLQKVFGTPVSVAPELKAALYLRNPEHTQRQQAALGLLLKKKKKKSQLVYSPQLTFPGLCFVRVFSASNLINGVSKRKKEKKPSAS